MADGAERIAVVDGNVIFYRKLHGWKYELTQPAVFTVKIRPPSAIEHPYISLTPINQVESLLILRVRYAWNGANWCPDFNSIMRGSLVHDALYQLMDLGLLAPEWRHAADDKLTELCLTDKMDEELAKTVHAAVRVFGGRGNVPKPDINLELTAPSGCPNWV